MIPAGSRRKQKLTKKIIFFIEKQCLWLCHEAKPGDQREGADFVVVAFARQPQQMLPIVERFLN